MYTLTIICLANSRKRPSGRCIAGKLFENEAAQEWIRPVSARSTHEVSEEERRYESGDRAQLLDIIRVPLLTHSPLHHQVENHTLADEYWVQEGVASWTDVVAALDPYDSAFWSYSQSTYHGLNDKVPAEALANIGSSLKLIRVTNLEIRVSSESGYENNPSRRRVRARFVYHHVQYWLSVTDPEVEDRYLTGGDGSDYIDDAILCVSLAEEWNGFAYRVVASIITPERCEA
jgi:hypothetical protein